MLMLAILLCCVVTCCGQNLPISFRVPSLALKQSYHYPSASKGSSKDKWYESTGTKNQYYNLNITQHNKPCTYFMGYTVYSVPGGCCQYTCHNMTPSCWQVHLHGLVQERRNSSVLAMELRLSCTNPSIRLVQERCNYSASAMELRHSCTNLSIRLVQERRNSSALAMG